MHLWDGAAFFLVNTGQKIVPSKHGLLTTLGYQIAGQRAVYALEGSIAVTGALVQWVAGQPRPDLDCLGD